VNSGIEPRPDLYKRPLLDAAGILEIAPAAQFRILRTRFDGSGEVASQPFDNARARVRAQLAGMGARSAL